LELGVRILGYFFRLRLSLKKRNEQAKYYIEAELNIGELIEYKLRCEEMNRKTKSKESEFEYLFFIKKLLSLRM